MMKIKAIQKKGKDKTQKRTRGYRLKPATHLLIVKIQKLLKSDQDEAIACACNMFYTEIKKNIILSK
ncbi:MAG: hypothetical protein EHM58_10005 [Ignavibacteriae bacterium]|nr:MAG: hypothetical protein EHM58_10005 [Ignavibacteriota bacterium]